MDAMRLVHAYIDAWNRHDAPAIVACFAAGGTYQDPASGPLTGDGIAQYAGGLFSAFPDLAFDMVSAAPAGPDLVALQWLMRGTHHGALGSMPSTGRTLALPGADFIRVDDEGIRSIAGYFDQKQFAEQLGLQTVVQPVSIGAIRFGTCAHMAHGPVRKPGAFSLTAIHTRSPEEVAEVDELSGAILEQLADTPGFISAVLTTVGLTGHTITAWEDAEAPRALLRSGAHREAMTRFFGPDFAVGGTTSVWVPARINASWVRCMWCGLMLNADRPPGPEGTCDCGASMPPRLPYW